MNWTSGCCVAARSSMKRRTCVPPAVTSACQRNITLLAAFVRRRLYRMSPLLLSPLRPQGVANENLVCPSVHYTSAVMTGRKDHEELVVITKTYDLILWSCQHTSRFLRGDARLTRTLAARAARTRSV